METTYYSLDTRRVTVCDMASGESARSYTCINPAVRAEQGPGVILDLDAYRRRLAGEPDGEAQATDPAVPADGRAAPRRRARRGAAVVLELSASLSLIAMAWVVVFQFVRFF